MSPPKAPAAADTSALSDRLDRAGLRTTPVRLKVLACLIAARRAMTHAEVEQALHAEHLDRVTLYRTLDSFAEAGLIAKMIGADRVARFVVIEAGDHDRHAHFTCLDCGRLYCLQAKAPRPAAVPEGFEVAAVDLNLRGRCAECGLAQR